MKRQSMAEQTLNKQINNLKVQEANLAIEMDRLNAKRTALFEARQYMEEEVSRLYRIRENASKRVTP